VVLGLANDEVRQKWVTFLTSECESFSDQSRYTYRQIGSSLLTMAVLIWFFLETIRTRGLTITDVNNALLLFGLGGLASLALISTFYPSRISGRQRDVSASPSSDGDKDKIRKDIVGKMRGESKRSIHLFMAFILSLFLISMLVSGLLDVASIIVLIMGVFWIIGNMTLTSSKEVSKKLSERVEKIEGIKTNVRDARKRIGMVASIIATISIFVVLPILAVQYRWQTILSINSIELSAVMLAIMAALFWFMLFLSMLPLISTVSKEYSVLVYQLMIEPGLTEEEVTKRLDILFGPEIRKTTIAIPPEVPK